MNRPVIASKLMTGLYGYINGDWAGLSHRLHQATAGAGVVVVVVFLVTAHEAVQPQRGHADQAGQKADAAGGAPLLDQLSHGA